MTRVPHGTLVLGALLIVCAASGPTERPPETTADAGFTKGEAPVISRPAPGDLANDPKGISLNVATASWIQRICAAPCPAGVVRVGYFACSGVRARGSWIACDRDAPSVFLDQRTPCSGGAWEAVSWCPAAAIQACRKECVKDDVRGQREGYFVCDLADGGMVHTGFIECPRAYLPADALCSDGLWKPKTSCTFPRQPRCAAGPGQCCKEGGAVVKADGPMPGPTCRGPDGYCVMCQ